MVGGSLSVIRSLNGTGEASEVGSNWNGGMNNT